MRSLQLIYGLSPRRGGPITALGEYIKAAHLSGIESRVIATDVDGDDVVGWADLENVDVITTGRFKRYAASSRFIESVVRAARDVDIIHVHGIWRIHSIAAMIASRATKTPFIVRLCGHLTEGTLRHRAVRKTLYLHAVERHVLQSSTLLHFTTDGERTATLRPFAGYPSFVLPPPIGDIAIQPLEDARHALGVHPTARLVVSIGRIDPIKQLEVIIRVLPRFSDVRLALIGPHQDGRYRAQLLELAAALGVADRLILPGFADSREKSLWLSAADAFVSASRHENFGVAIAEAAVASLPTVAPAELPITRDLDRSLLFHRFSLDELEEKLRVALSRPREARSLRTDHPWSLEHVGRRLRSEYERAVER